MDEDDHVCVYNLGGYSLQLVKLVSDLEIVKSISCSSCQMMSDDTRNNLDDEFVNELNLNHPKKFFDDETCLLTNESINFAPKENNSPLSILRDIYAT